MMIHLLSTLLALVASAEASSFSEAILKDAMEKMTEGLYRDKNTQPIEADYDMYAGRRRLENGEVIDFSTPLLAETFGGEPGFYHSVASGDPLPDSVIIWTRYTPVNETEVVTLEFRIAPVDPNLEPIEAHLDPAQNPALRRGTVTVHPESDWIAKIDVTGLTSGTSYVYAFTDGTRGSDVGLTKTAPGPNDDVTELRYAVFSCSNFPNGYFHAYDIASTIESLDLWIHTGDYFYEYGYAFRDPGPRIDPIMPIWEIVDLQDYRLRHASYVHGDEGLRNLRKSTPLMSSWDDHETTNNSYMKGAQNHQPTCPVNRTSPPEEIADENCDRDEGDSKVRFNHAFQAYLEWMPVRHQEGSMGDIDLGSFTQIIEWGSLATFITFDTRISYRSEDPTVGSGPLDSFGVFAFTYDNVTEYADPDSEVNAALLATAQTELDRQNDPQYTMIGDYMSLLRDTFQASADADKPWQIWAANVMVGPFILPDTRLFPDVVDPTIRPAFEQYLEALFSSPQGVQARAVAAAAEGQVPSNRDSFAGFSVETRTMLEIARDVANNMIILGGDVHDSYAWTLYEDYNITGDPVAVNLVGTAVSSNGLGPAYFAAFAPIADTVGEDTIYDAIDAAGVATNPGLVFTNQRNKGFFAVSVTPETHTAEYFLLDSETLVTSFTDARAANGDGLTADYFCGASLTTNADTKGSLTKNDACAAITFVEERNAVFDLPVPVEPLDGTNEADLANCGFRGCTFDTQETASPTNTPSGATSLSTFFPLSLILVVPVVTLSVWFVNLR